MLPPVRRGGAPAPSRDARSPRANYCTNYCANYFSIVADGKTIADAIWTYETPFPAMEEISGHLAFYPDKVKIEEVA